VSELSVIDNFSECVRVWPVLFIRKLFKPNQFKPKVELGQIEEK